MMYTISVSINGAAQVIKINLNNGWKVLSVALLLFASVFLVTIKVHADDTFLKFHWKFDEGSGTTAADASGNTPNYPGTLYNGPTWLPDGGLTLDGVDDYARTNSPIPGSMGVADQAYTLSASVRVAAGETEGNIIHISDGANGIGWCISMLHINQGKFRAIGWQAGQPVLATAPTAATPGEWYSIANTWSPETNELRLYVNGDMVAATPMTSYQAAGTNVYVFAGIDAPGCNNNQGWFKGDVKDVRIYSREISQTEAQDNSNQSLGIPGVSITAPTVDSNLGSWSPDVDWADSDECDYSWNNTDWTTADCAQAGADIPPPDIDGINQHLYIRGKYTTETNYGTDNVSFIYDTTDPVVSAGDNKHTGTVPFTQSSATATDATSGLASYSWSQQSGPGAVTFSNTGVLNPNVTAVSQDGTYVLRLTVTDEAGNTAHDDFTLIWDTTSPDIMLDSFPDLSSNQTSSIFAFSGSDSLSDPVTYQCKLDDASFTACTSPVSYPDLLQGEHSFVVRGSDGLDNQTDDLSYSWSIVADQTNDKNGDGIIDSQQHNVSSVTSGVTNKAVILEVDDSCAVDTAQIRAESTHQVQDPGYDYPQGLFNFTLDCGTPGFTATVNQYYFGVNAAKLVLRKYNPNTHAYFNITDATITTETIYDQSVVKVSYQVTDGGDRDVDVLRDGIITDPVGLAEAIVGAPNTGLSRVL